MAPSLPSPSPTTHARTSYTSIPCSFHKSELISHPRHSPSPGPWPRYLLCCGLWRSMCVERVEFVAVVLPHLAIGYLLGKSRVRGLALESPISGSPSRWQSRGVRMYLVIMSLTRSSSHCCISLPPTENHQPCSTVFSSPRSSPCPPQSPRPRPRPSTLVTERDQATSSLQFHGHMPPQSKHSATSHARARERERSPISARTSSSSLHPCRARRRSTRSRRRRSSASCSTPPSYRASNSTRRCVDHSFTRRAPHGAVCCTAAVEGGPPFTPCCCGNAAALAPQPSLLCPTPLA